MKQEIVKELLSEALEENEALFLIELSFLAENKILIEVDGDKGVTLKECMRISRYINDNLDREEEDFSLDVGSPGLDQPLKVLRQYLKLIGQQVSVQPIEGKKMVGELVSVEEENGMVQGLVLKTREKMRIEGRKAKQWVEEEHKLQSSDIEWTKVIISFK